MYGFTEKQINIIRSAIETMLDQVRENMLALDALCDPDYL